MLTNPKEIFAVVRAQTFAIQNELSRAKEKDGQYPLTLYNSFSRFPVVIINTDKKAATGNIPERDIVDIIKRSEYAFNKHLDNEYSPQKITDNKSPAYTVKISSGVLRGKTPAEVLLDNPQGKELLNNQYTWLKNNISKFPKNQEQMDAIVDASKLLSEGRLSKENASAVTASAITIYDAGMRPLIRNKRADGKCFVYEIKIVWNIGDKYPVNIEIQNYYAPVVQDEKGLLNVLAKQKSDIVKNNINLTAAEWNKAIYLINANMRIFENISGEKAYEEALRAQAENIRNAKKN